MALRLIYFLPSKLLSWMVLRTRSDTAKEIEILVLHHQLTLVQPRTPRSDRLAVGAENCVRASDQGLCRWPTSRSRSIARPA